MWKTSILVKWCCWVKNTTPFLLNQTFTTCYKWGTKMRNPTFESMRDCHYVMTLIWAKDRLQRQMCHLRSLELTALTDFHIWMVFTNRRSIFLKSVCRTIAGTHKAKEKLRSKAFLPLKIEQFHFQRLCTLWIWRNSLCGLDTKECLVSWNMKKIKSIFLV